MLQNYFEAFQAQTHQWAAKKSIQKATDNEMLFLNTVSTGFGFYPSSDHHGADRNAREFCNKIGHQETDAAEQQLK